MEVMLLGTLAGGVGMLIVFVVGYFLLKDRIAPVEVTSSQSNRAHTAEDHRA